MVWLAYSYGLISRKCLIGQILKTKNVGIHMPNSAQLNPFRFKPARICWTRICIRTGSKPVWYVSKDGSSVKRLSYNYWDYWWWNPPVNPGVYAAIFLATSSISMSIFSGFKWTLKIDILLVRRIQTWWLKAFAYDRMRGKSVARSSYIQRFVRNLGISSERKMIFHDS